MTDNDNREQSQTDEEFPDWANEPDVLMGSELGPYRLVIRADHDIELDALGYAHESKAVLTVVNTETDETLLTQDVHPVWNEEFSYFDESYWYDVAEEAIAASGADLEAIIAAARAANAA